AVLLLESAGPAGPRGGPGGAGYGGGGRHVFRVAPVSEPHRRVVLEAIQTAQDAGRAGARGGGEHGAVPARQGAASDALVGLSRGAGLDRAVAGKTVPPARAHALRDQAQGRLAKGRAVSVIRLRRGATGFPVAQCLVNPPSTSLRAGRESRREKIDQRGRTSRSARSSSRCARVQNWRR